MTNTMSGDEAFNVTKKQSFRVTRRDFVFFVAKVAVLTGIVTSVPLVAAKTVDKRRPPGAVDEAEFVVVCARCGRCAEVCPQKIIVQVPVWESVVAAGTPVLVDGGVCVLDFKCVDVCPTGALQRLPKEKAKMGTALLDKDKCIGCGACVSVCASIAGAIKWRKSGRKVEVDAAKCLGCGACVKECPVGALSLTPSGAYRPSWKWPKGG